MLKTHDANSLASPHDPAIGHGFSEVERAVLLRTRGIGEGVIDRIESVGVHTLRQLHELGVDMVIARVCAGVGNDAWRNRRRALARALAAVGPM